MVNRAATGKVTPRAYAIKWLDQRPELRPRTFERYERELCLHILPVLGDLELVKITPSKVREWNAGMLEAGEPARARWRSATGCCTPS